MSVAGVIRVGEFGRYWVAIVVFSDEELSRYLERGRRRYEEVLEVLCDGDRSNCEDTFIGDPEDYAAALIVSEALNKYCGVDECPIPYFDLAVNEEPGYGLPEYSVYSNPDARSWSGRWAWSGSGLGISLSETGIFFALVADESLREEIGDWVEDVIERENLYFNTVPGEDPRHWALVIVRRRR